MCYFRIVIAHDDILWKLKCCSQSSLLQSWRYDGAYNAILVPEDHVYYRHKTSLGIQVDCYCHVRDD